MIKQLHLIKALFQRFRSLNKIWISDSAYYLPIYNKDGVAKEGAVFDHLLVLG